MLNPIRDKPPASSYPVTDRIIGVVTCGIILGCLLGCLGPGQGREAHYISNEADKPIEATAAYQRPVETGSIEELIEDTTEPELVSLGTFKITYYCPCSRCCGKWADGITATGTEATDGRTVAVDPDVIPLGSTVIISGKEYIAEDTGVSGHHIDIYMESHDACLKAGLHHEEVCVYAQ